MFVVFATVGKRLEPAESLHNPVVAVAGLIIVYIWKLKSVVIKRIVNNLRAYSQ